MYNSPVELMITDIQNQILKQQDEEIYQAVLHYVPNVDREELIRALQYDRDQYEKGYQDGKADAMAELVRCKDCKYRVEPTKMCAHPRAIGWDALEPEDDDFCSCGERKDNGN